MSAVSRILRVMGLALVLGLLLASSGRMIRGGRRVQLVPTAPVPAGDGGADEYAATVASVRRERATLKDLLRRTRRANGVMREALKRGATSGDGSASSSAVAAAPTAAPQPTAPTCAAQNPHSLRASLPSRI